MVTEIRVDRDKKIIQRTIMGRLDAKRVINLVQKIALAIKLHPGHNVLIDIRNTSFKPEIGDLFKIAEACSKQMIKPNLKFAFIVPDTAQRIKTARFFRICLKTHCIKFKQFTDHDAANAWLASAR